MNGQTRVPSEPTAALLLKRWHGSPVASLARFPTGNHHYVYDAIFANGDKAVVRVARPEERVAMAGGLHWNEVLRPLGVWLPEVYFFDLEGEFPYLILERFPGADLGLIVDGLSESAKQEMAAQIIGMQNIVGKLPSAGRYGYAVFPELAPYREWVECLRASVTRSRERTVTAGIGRAHWVDRVSRRLEEMAPSLDGIQATPFLHDVTTKNVIVNDGRLSGIVDVDTLCYGDPLFQIALTKMGLLAQGSGLTYIDHLLESHGGWSLEILNLYTAICGLDFLSELGQPFNGNPLESSAVRTDYLESILQGFC